jgi:hypothetical protein
LAVSNDKSVAGSLKINEILASNTAYYAGNNEYTDWIEVFNNGSSVVDLGGFYLSDNKTSPKKWAIPTGTAIAANGYKIFYADELNSDMHTNFRLNIDGEYIGLYDALGTVVDSFSYKRQRNNLSFGRSTSDPMVLGYFQNPTPAAPNGNISYPSMMEKPAFSIAGGFYTATQYVTVTAAPGATVRYTTTGAIPTAASALYTGPLAINSTRCIRAVAIKDGLLISDVNTQTYFINESKTLPVVSLVTDPDNLFSNTTGIYVIGTNGIQAGCSPTPMNLNQDWERAVNIELYDADGNIQINQGAGVRIFGGCSRQRFPIKSFEVFARKQYGKGSFTCRLFKSKNIPEFESFLLRSSSDDQQWTMFRDALGHTLVSGLKDETQAYQPAVVYINGKYWGIQNIREKYNEAYFEENFGVKADNLNVVENNPNENYNVKNGSASDYLNMLSYLRSHAGSATIYETMNNRMDIESYIDYMASQIYLGADDWPGNNIRYWKANTGRFNRWRWVFYDMDQVLLSNNSRWNSILLATTPYNGNNWPNPPWSVELFNNLLKDNKFKYEFIQRICFLMNTAFSTEHVLHVIDSLRNNIAGEMPLHIQRWGGQLVNDPKRESWIQPLPGSMAEWEGHVQAMRNFAIDRPDTAVNMLKRFFKLSKTVQISISSNDPALGHLFMGPKRIPAAVHQGTYFSGIPLQLNAKPVPGYRLVRWEIIPSGSAAEYRYTPEIYYTPAKNTVIHAIFEPYAIEGPMVVINEINYHSGDNANTADWVELYNRVPDAVDISGWVLKDDNDQHSFEIPENIVLPVNGYYVVCEDTARLKMLYPSVYNRTGNFSFGFGNHSDCIRLYTTYGAFVDSVRYYDEQPWPVLADGQGSSLALIAPSLFNDVPQNWSDLYMVTPGDTNILESEKPVSVFDHNGGSKPGNWLDQNYPNPCNGYTTICYGTADREKVSLVLYDLFGRVVRSLVDAYLVPDEYKLLLNTAGISPGTYFYSLRIGNNLIQTRMMIVK